MVVTHGTVRAHTSCAVIVDRMRTSLSLGATLAVVVAAQFALPAALLFDSKQSAFGWQMYAGRVAPTGVEVFDRSGDVIEFDQWSARLRPEIDWAKHAPPFLCLMSDQVSSVRISYSDGRIDDLRC